jgi:hypothetical protein
MLTFGLVGDGAIAQTHKEVIKRIGGKITWIYDPLKGQHKTGNADIIAICSPTYLHTEHIRIFINHASALIVEKPVCLPWEKIPEHNAINIVLQYRYAPLPLRARRVTAIFTRDSNYLASWKGDPRSTGGFSFLLFIHYMDIALRTGADFFGRVQSEGEQVMLVDSLDLTEFNKRVLYEETYKQIIEGHGIKPWEVEHLHNVLRRGEAWIKNNTLVFKEGEFV